MKNRDLTSRAIAYQIFGLTANILTALFTPAIASAQPVSDGTTGTVVTPSLIINGIPSDRIDTGIQRLNNLFHSFSSFSVVGGQGVYFSNPAGVTNIFARVTGGSSSNIQGRLGVLGNANLYLINPQGFLFGPNSSLDLNGSLFVSSSDRIHFADGSTFSAVNPEPSALLTSSIPVGLGFGSNPGRIEVQGLGNQFPSTSLFSPANPIGAPVGLRVNFGKTITLLGGDIFFDRGVLTAPNGNIQLGSVRNGIVGLNPDTTLNYSAIAGFGTIQLNRTSTLKANGLIQLRGENLLLKGSNILSQNFSSLHAGNIDLRATNRVETGDIRSETYATGMGASLIISAKELLVNSGSGVSTRTYGKGNGGNISFNVSDLIAIDGFGALTSVVDGVVTSTVNSLSVGDGKSGDLSISTNKLQILNGGTFSTTVVGRGDGGSIRIQADTIELRGFVPNVFVPSTISAATISLGNAGDVTINTRLLSVLDGGRLDASTTAIGSAGSLTVNASEKILVSGTVPNSRNPSLIISSASVLDPSLAALLGMPLPLIGRSGQLTLNTPKLEVSNGAKVSVANDGRGLAGNLAVNANQVTVGDRGSITAATVSGGGGNINLQVRDFLLLENGGQIVASAGGAGNGGNIQIDTGIIIGVQGSQINANAFLGRGGNILIRTQGLFFTPDSSITASSSLGVSGLVSITNLDLVSKVNLGSPSINFVKVDTLVSNSCLAKRNANQGSFVVTGSGGLPDNPYNRFVGSYPLTQIQPVPTVQSVTPLAPSIQVQNTPVSSLPPTARPWQIGDPMIEPSGLTRDKNGEIIPTVSYADAIALVCPP
jgi:filamentous hemagglutinin family protein